MDNKMWKRILQIERHNANNCQIAINIKSLYEKERDFDLSHDLSEFLEKENMCISL